MIDEQLSGAYVIKPAHLKTLLEMAGTLGIPVTHDVVVWEANVAGLLARISDGGGNWKAVGTLAEWLIDPLLSGKAVPPAGEERPTWTSRLNPTRLDDLITGVNGVFEVHWQDHRFLLSSARKPMSFALKEPWSTVILGPSRSASLELVKTLMAEPWVARKRVRVWGNALESLTPELVAEDQLVLPPEFKSELLAYVDRFWKLKDRAAELKLPCRRGLLLVGIPGTGKSLFVRHLLTRYPKVGAHMYVASRMCFQGDNDLEALLAQVRQVGEPAMIILEDIDRMLDPGAITAEFFLNSLDGLLEVGVPLMWLATSNDPTGLERNLLDRPGRFDRIVIFQPPGPAERRLLIGRFSPLGIDEEAMREAVARSDSLTGAHLREACTTATLAALDSGEAYGTLLLLELRRVHEHHERARKHRLLMEQEEGAGFR